MCGTVGFKLAGDSAFGVDNGHQFETGTGIQLAKFADGRGREAFVFRG